MQGTGQGGLASTVNVVSLTAVTVQGKSLRRQAQLRADLQASVGKCHGM